ncbi:hypothetical protein D8674_039560 [Pyrus ussuriensis x Pyrus communis]|uniref:Uncharacterized protein n=1 Tax=Pyrus ussuriensis x Pyrus communis TaxID=2448454 RepID=A0A5N5FMI1_9ROSA|nr:hypothetical protein D8674_039560 [Pyrus ussuriensis x Pyrus communis]
MKPARHMKNTTHKTRQANAHWCHIDIEMFLCTGVMGPGIALTLAKTAKVFGDKEFLEAASDAAEVVWKR